MQESYSEEKYANCPACSGTKIIDLSDYFETHCRNCKSEN